MSSASNIIIREANKNDVSIIRELAHKIWPSTYDEIVSSDQLKYMLELIYSESSLQKQFDEQHHFLIIEEDKQAIAFADYSLLKDDIYKLNKIYALPSEQGKGIGKLLLNDVIKRVKQKGATS
ncbi:MAG: GNAT family N-acetyltransferase, partial [Parafilimonas sp.]